MEDNGLEHGRLRCLPKLAFVRKDCEAGFELCPETDSELGLELLGGEPDKISDSRSWFPIGSFFDDPVKISPGLPQEGLVLTKQPTVGFEEPTVLSPEVFCQEEEETQQPTK